QMYHDCDFAKDLALLQVEEILQQYEKHLCEFQGIPIPNMLARTRLQNGLLLEEVMFDTTEHALVNVDMERTLNECQRRAYDTVLNAVDHGAGGIFFLDGPGGSKKTYLYNCLLSHLRGCGMIALACTSLGTGEVIALFVHDVCSQYLGARVGWYLMGHGNQRWMISWWQHCYYSWQPSAFVPHFFMFG
ncbi:hypothetical protein GOP47_0020405, partial [Adiantum capillus-veneris]